MSEFSGRIEQEFSDCCMRLWQMASSLQSASRESEKAAEMVFNGEWQDHLRLELMAECYSEVAAAMHIWHDQMVSRSNTIRNALLEGRCLDKTIDLRSVGK